MKELTQAKQYFSNNPCEISPDYEKRQDELRCKEYENDIDNINAIIGSWIKNQEQNTDLRRNYAYIIFGLLASQIILVNVMMFFMGFGKFNIEGTFFHWFLTLVVGEIIGFVYVVAKYLFKNTDDALEQIIKLLKNTLC